MFRHAQRKRFRRFRYQWLGREKMLSVMYRHGLRVSEPAMRSPVGHRSTSRNRRFSADLRSRESLALHPLCNDRPHALSSEIPNLGALGPCPLFGSQVPGHGRVRRTSSPKRSDVNERNRHTVGATYCGHQSVASMLLPSRQIGRAHV